MDTSQIVGARNDMPYFKHIWGNNDMAAYILDLDNDGSVSNFTQR
jgi:hypothetical protein